MKVNHFMWDEFTILCNSTGTQITMTIPYNTEHTSFFFPFFCYICCCYKYVNGKTLNNSLLLCCLCYCFHQILFMYVLNCIRMNVKSIMTWTSTVSSHSAYWCLLRICADCFYVFMRYIHIFIHNTQQYFFSELFLVLLHFFLCRIIHL